METESKSEYIIELPVEIQKMLKDMDFPLEKKDIIVQAKKNKATPDILVELGMLPNKNYTSAKDVAGELHKVYMGVSA